MATLAEWTPLSTKARRRQTSVLFLGCLLVRHSLSFRRFFFFFNFIPPSVAESIRDRIYSEKTDVWAFGATICEIWTGGAKPYEHTLEELNNFVDLALKIRDAGLTPLADLSIVLQDRGIESPPAWLLKILQACFQQEPDERPSFSEIEEMIKDSSPGS